jgi:hypothetical protein
VQPRAQIIHAIEKNDADPVPVRAFRLIDANAGGLQRFANGPQNLRTARRVLVEPGMDIHPLVSRVRAGCAGFVLP